MVSLLGYSRMLVGGPLNLACSDPHWISAKLLILFNVDQAPVSKPPAHGHWDVHFFAGWYRCDRLAPRV